MRKTFVKKMYIIIIFILLISFVFKSNVYASYSIKNIFTDAQDFLKSGDEAGNMIDRQALKNTSSFIFKLLYSIGIIVAVAVGIVLGIQFMVASAEDKAKVKEAIIPYVVGCIVLFGAYPIWTYVVNLVKSSTTF